MLMIQMQIRSEVLILLKLLVLPALLKLLVLPTLALHGAQEIGRDIPLEATQLDWDADEIGIKIPLQTLSALALHLITASTPISQALLELPRFIPSIPFHWPRKEWASLAAFAGRWGSDCSLGTMIGVSYKLHCDICATTRSLEIHSAVVLSFTN